MPLENLGPYRILDPLGRGGMGTVYAAVDTKQNRSVAVKVLSPGVSHEAGFRERFEAEVRSLEQLRHPNIVQLFGYGEQDGHVYYAMEIMSGRSLQDELAAGRRFGWREAVPMIIDLCGALKHAHDHGIIHRDIKPANLLIDVVASESEKEIVKLSDFGIAKLFGNNSLTVDGGVLGTADYMSPEQADGDPVSPRSDLYSLGCVLYALLAGRPPFRGKSIPEVIHKVRFDAPPPISRFVEDIPQELERIIHQLLEKSPDDRVPTALALSKRLQALQHGLTMRLYRDVEGSVDSEPSDNAMDAPEGALHVRDTMAAVPLNPSVQNVPTPTTSVVQPDHYVSVERAPRSIPKPVRDEHRLLRSLTISGLILLLVFLAGTAWFLLTPPSADELFAAIVRANETGDLRLGKAESKVDRFLREFADDSRAPQVVQWRNQIEAGRIESRLERTMRHGWNPGKGSPLEELIMRGMQFELYEPDRATQMFQNVLSMYPRSTEMGHDDELLLLVVNNRLKKMQIQFNRSVDTHIALIQNRLDKAAGIVSSDPQSALAILQAIVDTYSEFSWADEPVQEAREMLEKMDTRIGQQ